MPPPTQRSKTKRRIGGVLGCGCAVLALCGFGGFMLLAKMFRDDAARLPTDLERAKQLGFPVTVEEVERLNPRVPDSQNAAPFYRKAFAEIRRFQRAEYEAQSKRANPQGRPLISPSPMEPFDAIKSFVMEGVKYPHFDMGADFGKAISLPYGLHFLSRDEFEMGQVFYCLDADIWTKQRDDDVDGELADIAIEVKLARQVAEYLPLSATQWLYFCTGSIVRSLSTVVEKHWKETTVLERAKSLLLAIKFPDLYKHMSATFVEGRAAIRNIESIKQLGIYTHPFDQLDEEGNAVLKSVGAKAAFDAKFVKQYVRLFEELPKDHENWVEIHRAITLAKKRVDDDKNPDGYVVRLLKPEFDFAADTLANAHARQRMLLLTVEILTQRTATGRYPEKLPSMGDWTIDPIARRPFGYRSAGDGFTLSCGFRDLTDKPLHSSGWWPVSNWDSVFQFCEHPISSNGIDQAWVKKLGRVRDPI